MKKLFFTIISVFLLTSCSDFLTESPRHDWDVDKAMTTYSAAMQAVNGIYGTFMKGDDMNMGLCLNYLNRSGLSRKIEKDFNFSYTQSDSPDLCWIAAYKTINAANFAINNIPDIPASAFASEKLRKELIGEARLLRAYAYSILLLNYALWWDTDDSKFGLVYRDQVTNASNVFAPRVTVGESWTKIIEDLDYAIANMPEEFTTPRKGSKFFAKAYKAKLLLIRGAERQSKRDIEMAKQLIDECLANIPNGISIQPSMADHFKQSWDSKENVFVRYLEESAFRTNDAGYTCHSGLGNNYSTNVFGESKKIPQSEAECGLETGLDWMRSDPRWYIATGTARKAETWDTTRVWTWTKIYRKGKHEGQLDPKDEKYAVYFMRLPELYLMQAELRARTGASLAESVAPINAYRAMRTVPKLSQIETPKNTTELWDVIFQEYCRELILENGSEYFASLRIEKNGHSYMEELKGANFIYDKTKRQFPVPNNEMINNKAILGMQNPGQE